MTNKTLSILANIVSVAILVSSVFLVGTTISQGEYDPWIDLNDDGYINIKEAVLVGVAFGTSGTPINKTELLLELESRIDALNATVTDLVNQISGCSGGVVNIKDYSQNYALMTTPVSGTVTLDFDNPFNSANYYLFTKIILMNDFDPGSGNLPAGTVVFAQNVVKTVANFTAEVWYGEDLLKGADIELFYIAIEMCSSTTQSCTDIVMLTCGDFVPPPTPVSNHVKIEFPITFTNSVDVELSASGIVVSGTGAGSPIRITGIQIETTYAILILQGWNGASWEDLQDGDEVEISYVAMES